MKKIKTQAEYDRMEKKARAMVAARTTEQLIADFEVTEKMKVTETVAMTRGWILDELQSRNYDAMCDWLDNGYSESPRKYFLGVA